MRTLSLLVGLVIFSTTPAWAAGPKTYQVTGPIVEIKGDVLVIEKGNEKWEVARDAATKVRGELKVGAKVTAEYRMTAISIEVKDAKAK
jgi:hypothetical protein